jgi:predicted dehydrogenase
VSAVRGASFRAGIVGSGFMGVVHAHAVRAAGGVVASVVAHRPEGTQRAVELLQAERASASVEELANADDIDAVHICTPNHTHAAMTEQVLAAGKAVICEKPLATTVADARRMTQLADDAGVVVAVPFVYRFYPAVREARARIGAGEAGPLWLLHGTYLQDWLAAADATNWRADPKLGGASRAFADIGVHWCDLMEFVTGHRITRLAARLNTAYPDRTGTEDGAVLVFDTDGGACGSLVVSQVSPGRKNRLWFSFDGSKASYSFDQETPDSLWVGGQAENRVVMRGPDTLSEQAARYARLPAGHPQGYQDCFNGFIADTYAAVAGRKPDGLPTFIDGLRAAVLTQAVVDAATANTWVEVAA